MSGLKKILFGILFLAIPSIGLSSPLGTTTFTITPSTTNVTLSDQGETSLLYTVTNATENQTIPLLSIRPDFQSTGKNLTVIQNSDSCSGTTLHPHASCTFRILIQGSNQPFIFTLTPKVCGFNGSTCSYMGTAPVTVTVNKTSFPTRAYEIVYPSLKLNLPIPELLGFNIANTEDVITHFFDTGFVINSPNNIAVSSDGKTIYVAGYKANPAKMTVPSSDQAKIEVLEVSNNALVLKRSIVIGNIGSPVLGLALSPDNKTLFVTSHEGVLSKKHRKIKGVVEGFIYRVNTVTNAVTLLNDPDNIVVNDQPSQIVISPNGNTVYVSTSQNYIYAFDATANSVTTANEISIPSKAIGMAIDPAGNTLYISNNEGSDAEISVLSVNGTSGFLNRIINLGSICTNAGGITVSADGATVYVAIRSGIGPFNQKAPFCGCMPNDSNKVQTTLGNQIAAVDVNNGDVVTYSSTITDPFGVSLSPNGKQLFVTQTSSPGMSFINTAAFSTSLTAIGSDSSYTMGNFIG